MTGSCDVTSYTELKNLFTRFSSLCAEELLEEDPLLLCYESSTDITVHLSMLCASMEISFSMTRDASDNPLGKLKFCQVNPFHQRNCVWTLYFDRQGIIRYSPNGPGRKYSINNRESITMIFVHLLAQYVMKKPARHRANCDTIESDLLMESQ